MLAAGSEAGQFINHVFYIGQGAARPTLLRQAWEKLLPQFSELRKCPQVLHGELASHSDEHLLSSSLRLAQTKSDCKE
jgi:hypothetical protein